MRATALSVLTLLAVAWAGAQPARADNIDEELLLKARPLMKELRDAGYQNVGVLKFRVQKGKGEPGFAAGLLNANMATRLEYALVLVNNDRQPLGITRDASRVLAARDPKATYLTREGRRALFGVPVPLAWGATRSRRTPS